MKYCWTIILLLVLIAHTAAAQKTANTVFPPPQPTTVADGIKKSSQGERRGEEEDLARYIIQLQDPPLVRYRRTLPSLPATDPKLTRSKKLDINSSASRTYRRFLQKKHESTLSDMGRVLRRPMKSLRNYEAAFNGMVINLSQREADKIARLTAIARITRDALQAPHTDAGPVWIESDQIWNGSSGLQTQGENIVIGILDTGINPENPSFADIGGDGYDHTNPRARYYGVCDDGSIDYDPSFPCNDKVIGAYDFTPLYNEDDNFETPLDINGHGSHVASTAAGNVVNSATIDAPTISVARPISGVAPHANIISYRIGRSSDNYAWLSGIIAAIEQAVIDGVDVINYSYGGGKFGPWSYPTPMAFLSAVQNGAFVATSAGNDGPNAETLRGSSGSPWLLTVGNSSHNRAFTNTLSQLTRGGGTALADMTGQSMTGPYGPAPIVYAGDFANTNDPDGDPGQCLQPYPEGTFSDQIVICDRGEIARVEKCDNVKAGGASGFILVNAEFDGSSLISDPHSLPAVHLSYEDGIALKNWLTTGSNHQATIAGTTFSLADEYGDILNSSSSRGPHFSVQDLIKPDIAAPGTNILAADGSLGEEKWDIRSGTSMSSPFAAGAAALLKSLHPYWSSAEIMSAMMTTAVLPVSLDGAGADAGPFDTGAGRLDVMRAANAGFVLDEVSDNYLAADPGLGGDPGSLNLASLARSRSRQQTSWSRTLKSTQDQAVDWEVSIVQPPDAVLSVIPSSFTLPAGGSIEIKVNGDFSGMPLDAYQFGQLIFTPASGSGIPTAHFPAAMNKTADTLPDRLAYRDVCSVDSRLLESLHSAMTLPELTVEMYGLTQPETFERQLYEDPTPDSPYDDASPEEGSFSVTFQVEPGTKLLAVNVADTTSHWTRIYAWRWDGAWQFACSAEEKTGGDVYCSYPDPEPGPYTIWVQNYVSGDLTGTTPDDITLAVAAVPDGTESNLQIEQYNSTGAIPAWDPFSLEISWNVNLDQLKPYWYGAFSLGTDPANPGNIGFVPFDIGLGDFTMSYAVTGSVLPAHGGSITCTPNPVGFCSSVDCTITTAANYVIDSIRGSCGGVLSGMIYTTDAVKADCTVTANLLLSGDINQDDVITPADTILALRVIAGILPADTPTLAADINDDSKIGIEEAIFTLRKAAGL